MKDHLCLNCQAPLTGSYCAACGQQDYDMEQPFWSILADYFDSVFALDGRVFRTLRLMFASPGAVARFHLDGKRASYVTPVKFYVFVTIAFFIALELSTVTLLGVVARPLTAEERDSFNAYMESQGVEVGEYEAPQTLKFIFFQREPSEVSEERARLDPIQQSMREVAEANPDVEQLLSLLDTFVDFGNRPEENNAFVSVWVPRLLVLFVPMFAGILWLLYRTKKVLLYDHLVFSLYFHASIFMAMIFLLPVAQFGGTSINGNFLAASLLFAVMVYLAVAQKKVYRDSAWSLSWRYALAALGYFGSSVITSVVFLFIFARG